MALDRSRFELEFDEDFASPSLDASRWVAHYLPQWTTPERSAARYELRPGLLRLRIDADQPAWRVEDGEMRVSNIQTGTLSGPSGSAIGQHRHRPDLAVRTPQPTRRLYTPAGGLVEATMRATADPTCMLAFWLVGFEESPEESGEICVAELFGHAVGSHGSRVRIGVKAHHDPRLSTDMEEVELPLDATDWHTYAAEWTPERVRFFVDDDLVRTVAARLDYPLQLMVDLFEFPDGPERDPSAYPKVAEVRSVRGHRAKRGAGHFLVRQARGPAWDASRGRREQRGWDEHAAFIDRLSDEGRILLGGPVGDVDGEHAVLAVRAGSEAEARAMFAGDPWMDGILRIESVEPWTLWVRGRPTDRD